jgi:hypothetical protein
MTSFILLGIEAKGSMGSKAKASILLRVLSDIFSWALILLKGGGRQEDGRGQGRWRIAGREEAG